MASGSPAPHRLKLEVLPGSYSVCRLAPHDPIPDWALASDFFSITNTPQELSIVCRTEQIPSEVQAEHDWACLKLDGPIPFDLTGVLSACLEPLARVAISIFAVSTFDTDYLLVRNRNLQRAVEALRGAGHHI